MPSLSCNNIATRDGNIFIPLLSKKRNNNEIPVPTESQSKAIVIYKKLDDKLP